MEENLPKLLAGAGVLLQYLRAQTKFPDLAYTGVALVLAVGAWVLVHGGFVDIAGMVAWIPDALIAIFGGTFAASKLASGAVALGANPSHPAVPVTNSKGVS